MHLPAITASYGIDPVDLPEVAAGSLDADLPSARGRLFGIVRSRVDGACSLVWIPCQGSDSGSAACASMARRAF